MMYELRVLTGLHRGAALPLAGEEWSIGSSNGADLALYDPGIKDRHCLLRLVDETWSLARHEGSVMDSEGHRVDAIDGLEPGTPFALNGVWLSVVSANTEWPEEAESGDPHPDESLAAPLPSLSAERDTPAAPQPHRARRGWLGPMLLISAFVVFFGALLWVFNQQEPLPIKPSPPARTVLKTSGEVKDVLQRMLKERELQSRISVVEENGKLMLHGRFDEDDLLQSTSRMLLHFERQYRSPIPVTSALPEAMPLLPFSIVQISNARLPNVLTSDGRRLFLGDEVDGVRLVDINDHQVVFEGDRRIELSW
ncbi:type III secretion protein HrpQ [Pseudomonas fluorescens]|uniref:Type III secretion protein HrpQ n=2 Tax=Pseudomonas fluorescens TaxID=294 RepID=A0A944HD18_PSEFL|nr:type III secretion protein HrpQ [Pseudomonas fluorescens]MBT2310061.1 type III secretion protein HrpQ [Pseudomonas fluorescens]MBT2311085.1 type III secretion protein HrpQ [Pseudomonas fluorescens]MBT2319980.1 type III secretion protein HrpQ [Pseudomonas fluorescens]MBT2328992.1 type III secretion protein HrpQ [Pseudomonas fluorescens]